jgi:flagellar hook assembly protein FlgD
MLQLSAHPNPTSSSATLSYNLPADSRVSIALYDAAGRLVRTLASGTEQKSGSHAIEWDGSDASGVPAVSGTYFYRVETEEGSAQGQIRIVR